jgi:hypothetical protein
MMTTPEIKRLGSYLVDAGLVTLAQIDVALNDQAFMDDMRIGDILVTRGWIKQQTLDFVIDKVVDPEQSIARRTTLEDAMITRQPPRDTATVIQPIARDTRIPEPHTETIAQARSLDGQRVLDILRPKKTYTVGDVTTPTDPGRVNERKQLSSIPGDDDDTNWAG